MYMCVCLCVFYGVGAIEAECLNILSIIRD